MHCIRCLNTEYTQEGYTVIINFDMTCIPHFTTTGDTLRHIWGEILTIQVSPVFLSLKADK